MGIVAVSPTWGETNCLVRGTYFTPGKGLVQRDFTAGQLYPITILYANGAERSAMRLSITIPSDSTVVDTTGYFQPPSCGASGIQIATNQPVAPSCAATGIEYINRPAPTKTNFGPNNYSPLFATLYSTIRFRGLTNDISFAAAAPGTSVRVYTDGPYGISASATFLRGYSIVDSTGPHAFTLNPDDVGYLWFGTNAISAWTSGNAVIRGATATAPGSYNVTLTAGVLTPIRLAFGNVAGAMNCALVVRDPGGVSRSKSWGWFVQPWCGLTPYGNWA